MNYDKYCEMKNFSQQQNFNAGVIRTGLNKVLGGLKSTGRVLTAPQRKLFNAGSADFEKYMRASYKNVPPKVAKNLEDLKIAQRAAGGPGVNPVIDSQIRSIEHISPTPGMQKARKAYANKEFRKFLAKDLLGTAGGLAVTSAEALGAVSIARLIATDKINPAAYYIFSEDKEGEPENVFGNTKGYATKDEAIKVRDEKFPGKRINLGKTLIEKYKYTRIF